MGIQLEDGKGSGRSVQVNDDNQLMTKSITEAEIEFVSEAEGLTFAWCSGTQATSAGDTILLVKNTSTTKTIRIDTVTMSADTDTRAIIHVPTSEVTSPTGTAVTGTNLNITSSNVADASAIRDETTNSQGNIVWSGEIYATERPVMVEFNGALILGTNDSVAIDYVSGQTAVCDCVIVGYYI